MQRRGVPQRRTGMGASPDVVPYDVLGNDGGHEPAETTTSGRPGPWSSTHG